jgi:hypothetical protein
MTTSLLDECSTLYRHYFSTPTIDRVLFCSWLRSTTKPEHRTASQFENFLLNSAQLRDRLCRELEAAYARLIGDDGQVATVLTSADQQRFVEACTSERWVNTSMRSSAEAFVRTMPAFAAKHDAILRQLHRHAHGPDGPELSEERRSSYLARLVIDPTYTLQDVARDVALQLPPPSPAATSTTSTAVSAEGGEDHRNRNDLIADIERAWRGFCCEDLLVDTMPSGEDIRGVLVALQDPAEVLQAVVAARRPARHDCPERVLDEFERVFGRPMSVREFLRHRRHLSASPPKDVVAKMHADFRAAYQDIKDVHARYEALELSEADCIRRYAWDAGRPGFVQELAKRLAHGPAYAQLMGDRIGEMLADRTSCPAAGRSFAADVEHALCLARDQGLDLQASGLCDVVDEVAEEARRIEERAQRLYAEHLERVPDDEEVAELKARYRAGPGFEETDAAVQADLVASLEYHDVIKRHIQECVEDKLPPHRLFRMLSAVLAKGGDVLVDREALRKFVVGGGAA